MLATFITCLQDDYSEWDNINNNNKKKKYYFLKPVCFLIHDNCTMGNVHTFWTNEELGVGIAGGEKETDRSEIIECRQHSIANN